MNSSFNPQERLNNVRFLNKYLTQINFQVEEGDVIEVFFESKDQRKYRLLNNVTWPFSYIYYAIDFIFKRIFPKFIITQKICFLLTKHRYKVLTLTEVMGRLIFCGFKILNYFTINGNTHIQACKVALPKNKPKTKYGFFIQLERIGKSRRSFFVYKFRTMHQYAEYVQDYMITNHKLMDGGKIYNDFRVTSYGRVMRKFWVDELPMILNLLKGDIKLVGVRPLSEHFFNLYPEDMQALRTLSKPGLIPPFYADLPSTFNEIIESERKYLLLYLSNPMATDWRYFWKAVYNIVYKNTRSR
jgi:hypothetical protein